MTKERIAEIAKTCATAWTMSISLSACERCVREFLSSLPEFQEEKWIPCSERMPEKDQLVFWYNHNYNQVTHGQYFGDALNIIRLGHTHWSPRHVPAPPVEEESELVKSIRAEFKEGCPDYSATFNRMIEKVKMFEKERAK